MPPEDEVITGSVAITEKDLAQGITGAIAFFRMRWFLAAMFGGALAFLVAINGTKASLGQWAPSGLLLVFFGAWVFAGPRLAARKLLRALIKGGDNQVLYRFDGEGGTIRASGTSSSFAYRIVSRVRETSTTLLLTLGAGSTSIVPKRAFSDSDLERLRQLLATHVKPEKAGGRKPIKLIAIWVALIVVFLVVWQLLNNGPR
jgi:hypothetical protein